MDKESIRWQWVSGCGADAAPFFRIFNPAVQAARFDPEGSYAARWISELDTPDYPRQIVNHSRARDRALETLAAVKKR